MSLAQPVPNSLKAADLAARFGAQVQGNAQFVVRRFRPLEQAEPEDASFVSHPRYISALRSTRAGLVVLSPALLKEPSHWQTALVCEDPYLFFAQAAQLLLAEQRAHEVSETQIHASAQVHESAVIGRRVRIGPLVVIAEGAEVGDDTDIGASVVLGAQARIGPASLIHAGVRIGANVQVGARAVIQSGAVIGSDGFGFAMTKEAHWVKIPQQGSVCIGDDVEIGANTVIDRGTLSDTFIGHGVKLDNLIQIAHNVQIGEHTAIAGCVGIAGSARIGKHCQIGGAAGVLGHLSIPDHTIIGPMSLVMSSIDSPGKYVGIYPLQPEREWEKSAVMVRRLPRMRHKTKE